MKGRGKIDKNSNFEFFTPPLLSPKQKGKTVLKSLKVSY